MKRGAWPEEQVKRKQRIETASVMMAHVQDDLDEIMVRVCQAMRRSSLVCDALAPAVERIAGIKADLDIAEREIRAMWSDERAQRNQDSQ